MDVKNSTENIYTNEPSVTYSLKCQYLQHFLSFLFKIIKMFFIDFLECGVGKGILL